MKLQYRVVLPYDRLAERVGLWALVGAGAVGGPRLLLHLAAPQNDSATLSLWSRLEWEHSYRVIGTLLESWGSRVRGHRRRRHRPLGLARAPGLPGWLRHDAETCGRCFVDELIGPLVGLAVIIGIIVFIVQLFIFILAALALALVSLAIGIVAVLDQLFGAGLLPVAPWLPWAICGALIGGAAAVSSFSDRLGWTGARASLPIVGVLVFLAGLAFLR